MDDVSGQKIDVIVGQWDSGVADSFSDELIQFAVIQPNWTLRHRWFVEVKLQLLDK